MEHERVVALRRTVWRHYRLYGRHELPWRKTTDPYRILVSEVMLQQTQVDRVIPKYHAFLERFPRVVDLAAVPLLEVLQQWQGLGYNRRAKMLHDAAKVVVKQYGGTLPRTYDALVQLPGVGPYTARAVCAFAYNERGVMIETNIRTVLFHHLYPHRTEVGDTELYQSLDTLCPKGRAREWYWALMDYGAYLKSRGVRLNHKSKHYTKQSTFKGSDRQLRGALLRAHLQDTAASQAVLVRRVHKEYVQVAPERIRVLYRGLRAEGLL